MQKDQEYVLRTVKELDVKFIRLWFTDVLGFLKNFAITPEELEGTLRKGWALTVHQSRVLRGSRKAT